MSKYASLPDIDTAPDVYETPDLPAVHISERDDDSDNDILPPGSHLLGHKDGVNLDISQASFDQSSARQKFASAPGLDSADADFSASLLRKQPRRSSARYPPTRPRQSFDTSEYSMLPRGYSIEERNGTPVEETPLERIRRLRFEIEQLEEELEREDRSRAAAEVPDSAAADPSGGGAKASVKGKTKAGPSATELLAEIQHIREQLGKLSTSLPSSDPVSNPVADLRAREAYAKSLLQQLTDTRRLSTEAGEEKSKIVPQPAPSSSTAAKLDARLSAIEDLLGASSLLQASSSGDVGLPPPLLVTVSKLEHQLSLLTQPRHLDSISRRVKVIVTDLERVHEARRKLTDHRPLSIALASGITVVTQNQASSQSTAAPALNTSLNNVPGVISSGDPSQPALPPDALHKLERLYNLLPRIDPLLPLVPHLLSRLRSLAELHSESHQFRQRLNESTAELTEISRRSKQLSDIMGQIEQSFDNNEKVVKDNLGLVGERMEKVLESIDRLKSSQV